MTIGVGTRVVKVETNHQPISQERGDHSINPEVLEKPVRRQFSAEYKLRILKEADACSQLGDVGKLLRREGLYSSHLTTWRRQRERGALNGLKANKRGRKVSKRNPLLSEVERLRKEKEQLTKQLKQAELIIEVQKKVSQLLGIPLQRHDKDEDD
jgi:transposase